MFLSVSFVMPPSRCSIFTPVSQQFTVYLLHYSFSVFTQEYIMFNGKVFHSFIITINKHSMESILKLYYTLVSTTIHSVSATLFFLCIHPGVHNIQWNGISQLYHNFTPVSAIIHKHFLKYSVCVKYSIVLS